MFFIYLEIKRFLLATKILNIYENRHTIKQKKREKYWRISSCKKAYLSDDKIQYTFFNLRTLQSYEKKSNGR
jgi:hypothetical protein